MAVLRMQMKKLVSDDKALGSTGSSGGLVLASSKSEVNADTVNAAASQAVRPVQQQQIRLQQQVQEITAFIASHTDPVLNDRLEHLNTAAVPVMTKRVDAHVWKDRCMAVRRGAVLYACSSTEAVALVGCK